MTPVILAYRAVLPADLPVLFGILDNRFAGTEHARMRWAMKNNRFFYWFFKVFMTRQSGPVISRIHFTQLLLGKTYLTLQIFPIYDGDPHSPPEGEAAQGVHPFDPHVNQRF